ncbi:MAG: lipase [Flammeovirgaceae bacterium TMED32]|nr:MAG: lipase [Flammeovirgaceae bacterium TMED32]
MRVNRINSYVRFLKYFFLVLYFHGAQLTAQILTDEAQLYTNLSYRQGTDDAYTLDRCVLDIYLPGTTDFATVVWFHGGGLTSGNKFIPEGLKNQGIAVVAVNYRLYPKVKSPRYIDDAAAAVAWVFKNIASYGGNPNLIFVAGHSAGGYLTSMLGLDKSYLNSYDIDSDAIAGLIPYSGHTITHFTVRSERELKWDDVRVDHMAPLAHIRKDSSPIILITGDRELELYGRYEENAYFWRMLQIIGHPYVELYELEGYNHGDMAVPAHHILLKTISNISEKITSK